MRACDFGHEDRGMYVCNIQVGIRNTMLLSTKSESRTTNDTEKHLSLRVQMVENLILKIFKCVWLVVVYRRDYLKIFSLNYCQLSYA